MAYVTPTTRADGYVVPASVWNSDVVNNPIALRTGEIALTSQAANDVIVATSATQLGRIASAANSVLVTDGSSVPSLSATLPTAVQDNITKLGAITEALDLSNAASGQIVFPATQNASAGANTLDDYEEGTWTPSLGGTATYTAREGRYTKIGNVVTLVGTITVNTIGTGSTNSISGVPFTEGGATTAAVAVGIYDAIATSAVEVKGYLTGTDVVIVAKNAASTAIGASAVFQNGARVDFSCTYLV